jgi:hypothetical protein
LKATGGLSCVLSAGISVPEEEVAPLDARQQVLSTGRYLALLDGTIDRVSWLAMLLPLVQDGILHARSKTSSARRRNGTVSCTKLPAHGPFERR